MDGLSFSTIIIITLVIATVVILKLAVKIVPQSENWVVERLSVIPRGKENRCKLAFTLGSTDLHNGISSIKSPLSGAACARRYGFQVAPYAK